MASVPQGSPNGLARGHTRPLCALAASLARPDASWPCSDASSLPSAGPPGAWGLSGPPYHAPRHTRAPLLFCQGRHPKDVQLLLGHANVSMTLDTYSHAIPGGGALTAAAMEQALAPDNPPEVEPLDTLEPPGAPHEPSGAPNTPKNEPEERRETS